jgi:hypothetical protein
MNIEVASPFGMVGDAGFAVGILNQANHSMKMKSVRPVGIGYPSPDPDARPPKRYESRFSHTALNLG